jgi:catechol 2,3-dioxygenase-like lactoylglutathione lyase family enzyme
MPSSLPIQRVHHVARVTDRPDESIAFYRDVLGFREIQRPPFSFRGSWLYNYGVQIHIIENVPLAQQAPEQVDTLANHLALEVDDIDKSIQLLSEHGISFFEQVNAGGIHQVFFQDPDGHIVEIAVYGPTPPAL